MLSNEHLYNTAIPGLKAMQKMTETEITDQLQKYLGSYRSCFVRSQQVRYFEAFVKNP